MSLFTSLTLISSLLLTLTSAQIPASCPDYSEYSLTPHEPRSTGPLHLPYMRPSPECRTFNSSVVENVLHDLRGRFKNDDLRMLFENAFTQTLDTSIKWRGKNNLSEDLTFVVTGDISAEWLRDTYNQLNLYIPLLPSSSDLQAMMRGVINVQSAYVSQYPNCGSFQPPPESGLPPQHNGAADGAVVEPPYDPNIVFECKLEIDSLGAFLALSHRYYEATNDTSFVTSGDNGWLQAVEKTLNLLEKQQLSTLDDNGFIQSEYNFSSTLDVVINSGVGPPQLYTGLVGTSFRPSDDKIVMRFNIPDNAFIAVQLTRLASFLPTLSFPPESSRTAKTLTTKATTLASTIRSAITAHGTITHPVWGSVYPYEVDGYGSYLIMDDANVPSLLSLPWLGFGEEEDPVYEATRRMILNTKGNPYYNIGKDGHAIGSPHTGIQHVWPMSLTSQILTTSNTTEIASTLDQILHTTSGLGLIHESFYVHNSTQYTRQWFCWANSYFATAVLEIAEQHPELIFKTATPYVYGNGMGSN